MGRLRPIETVSLLAILGALLVTLGVAGHWPPGLDTRLHRAIGSKLAQQALAVRGTSAQILVITRDTEAFPQPALDALLSSFQKEIRRALGKPASVRRLQVDPLRPIEVPSGDFCELIRRGNPGQVLVSLLGPPLLSEAQWLRAGPVKVKIIAFCPGTFVETIDLGRLFEAGFLHAAVVSRPLSSQAAARPGRRPSTYDELYMAVSASDRSQLSSLATEHNTETR